MGLIKDKDRYPYDPIVTGNDYLIGTDGDDLDITKNFSVDDLVTYISTQVSGTGQDNLFETKDLGTINEADSIAAAANLLANYDITETGLPIYTVTHDPTTPGGLERNLNYAVLQRGKGNYGVGGTQLGDVDFFAINPIQPETDRNSIVVENLIFADSIISGNVTYSGSGLIYESTDYVYVISGVVYNAAANNNIVLNTGDVTNPRIDVIAADTSGNIVVIEGTPAPSPVEPSLTDFDTQIKLTSVNVGVAATTPTGVTEELIYNENTGEPTEWTFSDNTGGARVVANSTVDTYNGTNSIRMFSAQQSDSFTLTNDAPITITDFEEINFRVKNTGTPITGSVSYRLRLLLGGIPVTKGAPLRSFGFDPSNTTSHQLVVIPLQSLAYKSGVTTFDAVQIFVSLNPQPNAIMHFDKIRLVDGTNLNPQIDLPQNTSDLVNDGQDGVNPFVDSNLYVADGTVTSNRVVTIGAGNTLEFNAATNGTGFIIDDANFRTRFDGTLDVGENTYTGSTGNNLVVTSFIVGTAVNDLVNSETNIVVGEVNSVTNTYFSLINGWGNTVTGGYGSTIGGVQITSTEPYQTSFGRHNDLTDAWYAAAIGVALNQNHMGGTAVGQANIVQTANNGINSTSKILFTVGNGTILAGSNDANVRSDALNVYMSGDIIAPSLTTALINAEATGKTLITKEWANATMTLDAVTDNGNSTTNQVYLGKVWTSNIQNNDTGNLLISGNQGLILRSHNANEGEVLVTSNGNIGSLSNSETIRNLAVSRLYNDALTTSNNEFYGIDIYDTVNMSTKTGSPFYAAVHINPSVTGGGDIRSIYSRQGNAIFSSGEVYADGFRVNALQTAPATAADTGTAGEIRFDANHIYVCTAANTWKRVAITTW